MAPELRAQGLAAPADAYDQGLGQVHRRQDVDDHRLRELAHQVVHLVRAGVARVGATRRMDAEIQPPRRELRIGEPVGEDGLNGDVLLVAGDRVH